MLAEFLYRAFFAGFYGSLTQAFRQARPAWVANLAIMILLSIISHSIELFVHLLCGTSNLKASITVSVCFTSISTLFNIFAMRRDALIVGDGARTVSSDLRQIPGLIVEFLAAGQITLRRSIRELIPPLAIKLRNEA